MLAERRAHGADHAGRVRILDDDLCAFEWGFYGHAIHEHEVRLTQYALDALGDRFGDRLTIYGPPTTESRGGVLSFLFPEIHAHDVSQVLDEEAVCVRAGHHCAKPLMRVLGIPATSRASVYLYNDTDDIDALVDALAKAEQFFAL